MLIRCLLFLFLLTDCLLGYSNPARMRVVGYYAGNSVPVDSLDAGKLTHLIYCFGKLDGARFTLRNTTDSVTIDEMVNLKRDFPALKVMLSLGGWGGCETCSDVFSTAGGRDTFAASVKRMSDYFGTDGIDLDWEYPVVKGFPGHRFSDDDRPNFTALLKALRRACGSNFEISFAAGGFTAYLDSSVEWKEAIRYVDFINIMSYDLVHGYSSVSGHHTPLYSTPEQIESTDHAVQLLVQHGVPRDKMVIGCGFYGRMFEIETGYPTGLYQPCRFLYTFQSKYLDAVSSPLKGFELYYDTVAQAPYAIQPERRLLATFDDARSVGEKTDYLLQHGLGGIMFWQLCDDKNKFGLLDVIHRHLNLK